MADKSIKGRSPLLKGGRVKYQGGGNEWWTGIDPKDKTGKKRIFDPSVDKKLREGKPHSSPEGRWKHVSSQYTWLRNQAKKAKKQRELKKK